MVDNDISATATTLLSQAHGTAEVYMTEAVKSIDRLFGKGFAQHYPDLVAAFMKTAAIDFATAIAAKNLESVRKIITELMGLYTASRK